MSLIMTLQIDFGGGSEVHLQCCCCYHTMSVMIRLGFWGAQCFSVAGAVKCTEKVLGAFK